MFNASELDANIAIFVYYGKTRLKRFNCPQVLEVLPQKGPMFPKNYKKIIPRLK